MSALQIGAELLKRDQPEITETVLETHICGPFF